MPSRTRPCARRPRIPFRIAIAAAVAFGASPVFAQTSASAPSPEELAARLAAIERLLGVETAEPADPGNAADPASSPDGDARGLAALEQRLRILERKLEVQAEETAAQAARTPTTALTAARGLSIKSPDGVELRLRGLIQADGRFFLDDDGGAAQSDTFLMRRIRPTLEGSWGPLLGFRLTPEFAGDSASIVDAYVDLKFDPRATVRIGKVKGPVGLERLQSGGALAMVERAFPTELAPNRDLGVQLQGELRDGTLQYVVGVYNGAPDGRDAATTNADDAFEYAGRVFWEPFRNDANAWSGLGIGIAASDGETFGTGTAVLPRYRTPAQAQFFAYGANVSGDGLRRRVSPQGYFYRGAFGLLAEYIVSEQELRVVSGSGAGRRARIENDAYQLTASYVLSGEDASFRGVLKPDRPFAADGAGWGAFELVGRYGVLDIDDDAFPLFANPAQSATRAESWSVGLNWYLNSNLKLVANYTHTAFDGGAAAGADREDERTVLARAQVSF